MSQDLEQTHKPSSSPAKYRGDSGALNASGQQRSIHDANQTVSAVHGEVPEGSLRRTWTSQAVIFPSYEVRRMSEPNLRYVTLLYMPRRSEAKPR
jgi:hypothetical protein